MIGAGAADVHQDDHRSLQVSDAFSKAGTGKTTFTDGADSPRISPLKHLHPYQNQRNHNQHHNHHQHCHHHHIVTTITIIINVVINITNTIIITIVDTSASCLIPGLEAAALSQAQRLLLSIAWMTGHRLLMRPFRSF